MSPHENHPYAVDVAEAAELTGLSEKAVRRRLERGTLRAMKLGNRRMIPVAELERRGLLNDGAPGQDAGTHQGPRQGEAVGTQQIPRPATAPAPDVATTMPRPATAGPADGDGQPTQEVPREQASPAGAEGMPGTPPGSAVPTSQATAQESANIPDPITAGTVGAS